MAMPFTINKNKIMLGMLVHIFDTNIQVTEVLQVQGQLSLHKNNHRQPGIHSETMPKVNK